MRYDIIGDIHGHADALEGLLSMHGYRETAGAWRHRDRKAIFVGDFVDRGPQQVRVFETVHRMIDAGTALAVMGNHEFNMIGFATRDRSKSDTFLRERTEKNRTQHKQFLDSVGIDSALHLKWAEWCRSLPLWLDMGAFRVVHACWHPAQMDILRPFLDEANRLTDEGMHAAHVRASPAHRAVSVLLTGPEVSLPDGLDFEDKDGHKRRDIRVKWWEKNSTNIQEAYFGANLPQPLPDSPLPECDSPGYDGVKPVFFGHYWLSGSPVLQTNAIACLDFSVAKAGVLCSYSWDGETTLDPERLSWIHQGKLA